MALEVRSLGKSFGPNRVLDDVSFQVGRGEFVAVLGPSGAGKTTLIRCIAALAGGDEGSVTLEGVDVRSLDRRSRRRIAVIFQQFNLVPRRTAFENVLAGRLGHVSSWRGMTLAFSREDRLLALDCLERVGLLAHASQRADTLSGGQQQRVAIARALAQQPEVIVADEPVASLDPAIGADILGLLRGICDDGVSVVCSLHQVHFAKQFSDRIVGLSRGRVVGDFVTREFDRLAEESLYGPVVSGRPSPSMRTPGG